ncbi:MAG: methyltransferase [Chitinophagaceae bacterium]|nr:methyltransferase [Chitinophagaceae bacterium]
MANPYFRFKQFIIHQDRCAMKVTTDACLFGAWVAREVLARSHTIRNMLDIGTGTGLLTLMLAQKNPGLVVDAIEIDKATYEQAKENIAASPFKNKIYLEHGDILNEPYQRKYDIIISNPPFYEKELLSASSRKNVAHHNEGLLLEDLLPVIKNRLLAASRFYLLLPYKRKKEIDDLLKKNSLYFTKIVSVRQSVNHDHFRLMIEGALYNDHHAEETDIAIKDENDQYTPGFIKLLNEYYLYL